MSDVDREALSSRLRRANKTLARRGTLQNQEALRDSLCGRCANGTVYRRGGQGAVVAYCAVTRGLMPTDLAECSAFLDPNEMTLYDMTEVAVLIDKREGPPAGTGVYA